MSNLIDILRVGVFAPKPPSPQQWVSESGVKFHLEKPESRTLGRGIFTAICGLNGEMYHERFEGQHTFLRCFDCERIQAQSTTGILDVAARNDGLSCSTVTYGATGGEATATASPLQIYRPECCPSSALNAEEEVSTGSRKRSECAVHGSVGRPTDFLSLPVPLGREVSGSSDARTGRDRGGDAEPRHLNNRPKSEMTASNGSDALSQVSSGEYSISPADQILPEPFTLQQTGATASTSLSVVPENFSCFIERIDEFVAARLLKIADCFCGRPSVHECPCGEPICANHSYNSLCGTCTEAKQLQQSSVMDGESRY